MSIFGVASVSDEDLLSSAINLMWTNNHEKLDLDKHVVYNHEIIFNHPNYNYSEIKIEFLENKFITVYLKDHNKHLYEKLPKNIANGPFLVTGFSEVSSAKLSNGENLKGLFFLRSYIEPFTGTCVPYKLARDISNNGMISRIYTCEKFNIHIESNIKYIKFSDMAGQYNYYDDFYNKTSPYPMVIIRDDAKLYNLNKIIENKCSLSLKYNKLTKKIKLKGDDHYDKHYFHNDTNYIYHKYDVFDDDPICYKLSKPLHYDNITGLIYVPLDFFQKILYLDVEKDKVNNFITIYFKNYK